MMMNDTCSWGDSDEDDDDEEKDSNGDVVVVEVMVVMKVLLMIMMMLTMIVMIMIIVLVIMMVECSIAHNKEEYDQLISQAQAIKTDLENVQIKVGGRTGCCFHGDGDVDDKDEDGSSNDGDDCVDDDE